MWITRVKTLPRAAARTVMHAAQWAKGVLTRGDRQDENVRLIASSELFDRAWYLEKYPHVADARSDPALHYLRFGAREEHDPGPGFSTLHYLRANEDVRDAGVNPLVHYLKYGKSEGRNPLPSRSAPAFYDAFDLLVIDDRALPPLSFGRPPLNCSDWLKRSDFCNLEQPLLRCGDEVFGAVEMDLACGASPGSNGLLHPIMAFCSMCRTGQNKLYISHGQHRTPISDAVEHCVGDNASHSLAIGEYVHIRDIWFANSRVLRLRLGSRGRNHATEVVVVRGYQCVGRNQKLSLLTESLLPAADHNVVAMPLLNPYLPLLVVATSTGGMIRGSFLLPFPSLSRGGAHYAETCAIALRKAYVSDLDNYGYALLKSFLHGMGSRVPSFVDVDMAHATGAELIFSPLLREWLDTLFRLRLDCSDAASRLQFLCETSLNPGQGKDHRRPDEDRSPVPSPLRFTADAIPTICGLLMACDTDSPQAMCGFVLADPITCRPRYSVTMPASYDPAGRRRVDLWTSSCPSLRSSRASAHDEHASDVVCPNSPIAIRFLPSEQPSESELIRPGIFAAPVAAETPAETLPEQVGIILTLNSDDDRAIDAAVARLSSQLAAQVSEIIVLTSAKRSATIRSLERYFPARHRLVETGADLCRAEAINRAAELVAGEYFFILSDRIVLHNPKTISTLCTLLDSPKVAAASCLLVAATISGKTERLKLVSGGYTLALKSTRGDAGYSVAELTDRSFFRLRATIPVIAGSPELFMFRRTIWNDLGGLDPRISVPIEYHIDLSMRALRIGHRHAFTYAISAGIRVTDSECCPGDICAGIGACAALDGNSALAESTMTMRPLVG